MSLSLYIVCLHQGIIRVITESQVGSTFEIYLPLTKAEGRIVPSEQDTVPNVIEGKIQTIAVVDDQLSNRQLLNSCLKRLGYTVSYFCLNCVISVVLSFQKWRRIYRICSQRKQIRFGVVGLRNAWNEWRRGDEAFTEAKLFGENRGTNRKYDA